MGLPAGCVTVGDNIEGCVEDMLAGVDWGGLAGAVGGPCAGCASFGLRLLCLVGSGMEAPLGERCGWTNRQQGPAAGSPTPRVAYFFGVVAGAACPGFCCGAGCWAGGDAGFGLGCAEAWATAGFCGCRAG